VSKRQSDILKSLLALLLPFITCSVQWLLWDVFKPFVWFLFYPTVYFTSRIAGKRVGLLSTVLCAILVTYCFIPPQLSFTGKPVNNLLSVVVFLVMGFLFSHNQERLERAERSEAQARVADERLQESRILSLEAEQRLAREMLRESEEQFRIMFMESSVGEALIDTATGRFLKVNAALCRLLGRGERELLQLCMSEVTHPDDRQACLDNLKTLMAGDGEGFQAEKRYLRPDGEVAYCHATVNLLRDGTGEPKSLAVMQDVTERKKVEAALLESERKFYKAFSGNAAAIALTRLEGGVVLEVNDTWLEMTGYSRHEVVGRSARHMWTRIEDLQRFIGELRGTGTVRGWEQEFLKKSGEIFVTQLSSQLLTVGGEEVILTTLVDITALKQAEAALRESETRFRTIFDHAPVAIGIGAIDDGRLIEANGSWLRLLGHEREEAIGRTAEELGVYPSIAKRDEIIRILREQKGVHQAMQLHHKSGEMIDVLFSAEVVVLDGRSCLLVMLNDLTEKKRAEVARNATVELLRICNEAENVQELMSRTTLFFQQLTGCEAVGIRLQVGSDFPYYESVGFPHDFVAAENSLRIGGGNGAPGDEAGRPALLCMCGSVICGRPDATEPFFTPRGSFWTSSTTDFRSSFAGDHGGEGACASCNTWRYESVALIPLSSHSERIGLFQFNDRRPGKISAEKVALYENLVDYISIALSKLRTDEALLEASQFNEQIVASAQEGIIVYGPDLRYRVWNPYMEQFTGTAAAEVLGRHPLELFPFLKEAGVYEKLEAALKGEISSTIEFPFDIPENGRSGWLADTRAPLRNAQGEIIGVIGTVRDITGQRHLEEQLRQAQKMEAIGQLAGGVAHDFNNVLQVIMGYCSLLQADKALSERQGQQVEQIVLSAERAAQLTQGLLAFSRKQVMSPKRANLWEIVQHVQKFLVRIIGEDIQLEVVPSEVRLLPVVADSGQIEQVLINLATNARDAMAKGGTLSLKTEMVEFGFPVENPFGHAEPGRYACVTMSDTGCGMDEATCSRIFEPFFTTKEVGKGTGLGMAIVYGIVKQHSGFINVYSEPGIGTAFRIYLPLAEAEAEGADARAALPPPLGGTETILLAEDDAEVRKLMVMVLTRFGYEVIQAEDGQQAVELFAANRDRIGMIVMDMIMPRKNGRDACEEICRLEPGVKVLFSSGYTSDFMENRGVSEKGINLIMKPVQPVELLRKIRETLDAGAG